MKKKGFTLIELMISCCLVSVIVVILFQLIFALKELYVSGDIKTMMLNRQGIMTRKIYEEINNKELTSIDVCGISCLNFHFTDGEKKLLIDVAANTITYGNYTMTLSEGSKIGNVEFKYDETITPANSEISSGVFKIAIPIESNLLPGEDFGIYIISNYKPSKVTISKTITSENKVIIASGVPLKVETINVPTNIPPDEYQTTGYFVKIYDQKRTFNETQNEFMHLYNKNDTSSYSTLESLFVFKSTSRKEQIKNDLKTEDSNISNQTNEHLNSGYYELIYGFNTNLNIDDTNYFVQCNDITKKIGISEFDAIQLMAGNNNFYGLSYNNFVNNDKTNKQLWVRVDDYINKYGFVKLANIS